MLGSFHRGSILFLIKWHSVAGGLAGTQLPRKPKNAGLHLATNSHCMRRVVLHSCSSILLLLRPVYVCECVSIWNGVTVEGVRYGDSSHSSSPVDVCLYHSVLSVPVLAGHLKTHSTSSPRPPLLSPPRSLSITCVNVNGGNRAAIKMHI